MAQAKIVTEQEFKRALSILRDRRHVDRDRLALRLTQWPFRQGKILAAMIIAGCAISAVLQPTSAWPWWGASEPLRRGAQALQQQSA